MVRGSIGKIVFIYVTYLTQIGRTQRQASLNKSTFDHIVARYLLVTLNALRPAWACRREKRRLHPTSWLDGVRGLAALLVCVSHFSGGVDGLHFENERTRPDDYAILRTPIIRLIIDGSIHVGRSL